MSSDIDLDYRSDLRRKAKEMAGLVISGDADLLEVSKSLWTVLQQLDLGWEDEDSSAFGLIADETEHLPIGPQRRLWASVALKRKEPDIARARKWAEEIGLPACRRILARWDSEVGAVGF